MYTTSPNHIHLCINRLWNIKRYILDEVPPVISLKSPPAAQSGPDSPGDFQVDHTHRRHGCPTHTPLHIGCTALRVNNLLTTAKVPSAWPPSAAHWKFKVCTEQGNCLEKIIPPQSTWVESSCQSTELSVQGLLILAKMWPLQQPYSVVSRAPALPLRAYCWCIRAHAGNMLRN